jgi:hypothetical protein
VSARGLHVLMGGAFVHEYVGQCGSCSHRRDTGGDFPVCAARQRKICCPKLRKRRHGMCDFFDPPAVPSNERPVRRATKDGTP